MQSLHPLPHTNPFDGTTKKAVSREDIVSKQSYFYQPPVQPRGGQRGLWDRGYHRQAIEPDESLQTQRRAAWWSQWERVRDPISAQNFKHRTAQVRKWR